MNTGHRFFAKDILKTFYVPILYLALSGILHEILKSFVPVSRCHLAYPKFPNRYSVAVAIVVADVVVAHYS